MSDLRLLAAVAVQGVMLQILLAPAALVSLVAVALVIVAPRFRDPNVWRGLLFGVIAAVATANGILLLPVTTGTTFPDPPNSGAVIAAFALGICVATRWRRSGARATALAIVVCAFAAVAVGALVVLATVPRQGRG